MGTRSLVKASRRQRGRYECLPVRDGALDAFKTLWRWSCTARPTHATAQVCMW